MINLGDRVKDRITGFVGIATARTEWINGCVRFGVQSDTLKDGLPTEAQWFDEPQLAVLKAGQVQLGRSEKGGPIPTPRRAADPVR